MINHWSCLRSFQYRVSKELSISIFILIGKQGGTLTVLNLRSGSTKLPSKVQFDVLHQVTSNLYMADIRWVVLRALWW